MTVTYIHHSCFLVEMRSAYLLFDWFEGALPPIPERKPLYVLASHDHEDHFSEEIFALLSGRPGTTFLLSFDIPEDLVPEPMKSRTHFLRPHEHWQDGILSVKTFRSTDEGIAFWCALDGKQLYHAGDLNHWYWEGEDEAWNRNMTAAYREEMALLAGKRADIAFLPVDPRLGDWFYLGADDFMNSADAEILFPMHFWGDFSVCETLRAHPRAKAYRDRIITIRQKGQSFSL